MEKDKIQMIVEIEIKKGRISQFLGELKTLKDLTLAKLVSYKGDLEEG